jgi:hypothetical protein
MLTPFSGAALEHSTIELFADYPVRAASLVFLCPPWFVFRAMRNFRLGKLDGK